MKPEINDSDFELLSQYLDGELDELSTRRIAQRLQAEPALRATLNQLAALDQNIQLSLAGRGDVPAHVAALLRPAAPAAAFRKNRQWHYAVAASLVAAAGALLAVQLQTGKPSGPTVADVLEITPSMATGWQPLAGDRRIRPILTFRDVDGAWCREFLLDNQGKGSRGVACRDQGKWETRIAVAAELPDGGPEMFRPASSFDVDAVADYTARRADGIALSAGEESALIAGDWKAD
ncbi:anti-sigma factor family protein [Haliea sp. E17]|uniref:anti-sigma factor family protein n=1 Tax=Haliea sp. E17 TaxID=3401576 RepID=UPI003AAFE28C